MRAIARAFFKDSRGDWHQPGTPVESLDEEELRKLEEDKKVRIVRTQMKKPPRTRGRRKSGSKTNNGRDGRAD